MTITRTIKTTKFIVHVFRMNEKDIVEDTITVSGERDEESKEYKKAVKEYEKEWDGWKKVLDVVSAETISGLYAMSEETFLQYAERIGDGR